MLPSYILVRLPQCGDRLAPINSDVASRLWTAGIGAKFQSTKGRMGLDE
jgi:hypothetical protein